jgi:hypothetical protein
VTYHARLPVAWGGAVVPTSYPLTLPARVAAADQLRFASLYGTTCAEPSSGGGDAGNMFFVYRPLRAGCVLAPDDVVTETATVTRSADDTIATYPEYDRVWADGALNVVLTFTRYAADASVEDDGRRAYDAFVQAAAAYLGALQPDDALRSTALGATGTLPRATLGATLPDGRKVLLDAVLVGPSLRDDEATFDPWYDARTPAADLLVYSGHAGLGDNVRALMAKGKFRAGQYAVWVVNGCDTLAYVDRSLAERRARLNLDDPRGTKYLDTVSNVMPALFDTGPATAMTFIAAMADAPTAARSYRELLAGIDPAQVVVVNGDDDNAFQPPGPVTPSAAAPASPAPGGGGSGPRPSRSTSAAYQGGGRCSAVALGAHESPPAEGLALLLGALGALTARRRAARGGHAAWARVSPAAR